MYDRKLFSVPIVICSLILTSIFFSCKKDPNSLVGSNLHPEDEIFQGAYDTNFDIIAFTIPYDSLNTQNQESFLLGSANDPTFGKTTMSIVGLFARNNVQYKVPEGSILDSVVLTLAYSEVYPEKNKFITYPELKLNILELDEILNLDSLYYSSYLPKTKINSHILKDHIITPKPFDTTRDINDNNKVVIKPVHLKLDSNFGVRLMNVAPSDYADIDKFMKLFNGLHIKAELLNESNAGSIFSFFSEISRGTKITIFYKYPMKKIVNGVEIIEKWEPDEQYFSFLKTNTYTHIAHDRTFASPLFKSQLSGDTSAGQQRLFLQSGGGSFVKFKLPNIENLKNQKVVINQASLVLTDANTNIVNPPVNVPTKLISFYLNENGKISDVPDNSLATGVPYNPQTGEYRIYLTRYIQQTLFHKDSMRYITLSPNLRFYTPNQVEVFGPSMANGAKRMRLEVIYTKIP